MALKSGESKDKDMPDLPSVFRIFRRLSPKSKDRLSTDEAYGEAMACLSGFSTAHRCPDVEGIDGRKYPVTIVTDNQLGQPLCIRAGEAVVINTDAFLLSSHFKGMSERLQRLLDKCPTSMLLHDDIIRPSGWGRYTPGAFTGEGLTVSLKPIPYILPWTIGQIIAIQEMADKITGKTFVDVGSGNAMIAIAAQKFGAHDLTLIECTPKKLPIPEPLRGIYNLPPLVELIETNLNINGCPLQQARILREYFADVKCTALDGGVVAYSMPSFGSPYDNAPEHIRDLSTFRDSGFNLADWSDMFEKYKRPSLLRDILEKFTGVKYVIASGGHGTDEETFIKEAMGMGLRLVGRPIRIPYLQRREMADRNGDETIIASTMVLRVDDATATKI